MFCPVENVALLTLYSIDVESMDKLGLSIRVMVKEEVEDKPKESFSSTWIL
jgi:hypothetical protein